MERVHISAELDPPEVVFPVVILIGKVRIRRVAVCPLGRREGRFMVCLPDLEKTAHAHCLFVRCVGRDGLVIVTLGLAPVHIGRTGERC